MALTYTNKTFDELLGLIPDPAVKEAFNEWEERGQNKLTPYKVTLDGKEIKVYGELDFIDGQKSITYETTYGDIISLKGKRKPKTTTLNFIIEYDFINDNEAQMRQQITDLEKIKKDRTPVLLSISELNVEYPVTLETLRVTYRGVRDIYVQTELMEVYEDENNNR